jgi:RNA polymerase sigma-70 factor (ECF subfamily)
VTGELIRTEAPADRRFRSDQTESGGVPDELEIEALAERSRQGCRDSFEALVSHFERRVYHYLFHTTRNEQDAQDLTQITFLKAYQNIHAYQSRGAFHSWLFTIAKRTVLNHFRGSRPVEELQPDLAATNENPSYLMEKKDACSDLWRLARSLKPAQYDALWLRYAEGFSVVETARIMKTNSLRVRVLLHRGRAALQKKLAGNSDLLPSLSQPDSNISPTSYRRNE